MGIRKNGAIQRGEFHQEATDSIIAPFSNFSSFLFSVGKPLTVAGGVLVNKKINSTS